MRMMPDSLPERHRNALHAALPLRHRDFLHAALEQLPADPRIAGVAAGGSFRTGTMDEFSDLDLLIAIEPEEMDGVMAERQRIAASLGPLLAAFTGEHVGEPRLLICLYDGAPILHVDLKFLALPDAARRVEDPCVLWERDGRLTQALAAGSAAFPEPDLQWIEDRFWVWMQYGASKIGRGELFEALDGLSFLRAIVLGPLALARCGARPAGVRRIEQADPAFSRSLQATLAAHSAADCLRALRACADLYRALRGDPPGLQRRQAAENAAMQYLEEMERHCSDGRRYMT
jgi:hypothetical protein